jgi:hypothetical protein
MICVVLESGSSSLGLIWGTTCCNLCRLVAGAHGEPTACTGVQGSQVIRYQRRGVSVIIPHRIDEFAELC